MKHYILNLDGYSEDTAAKIIQNIRFWCVDFVQRGESSVYDITSSYDLTPEFLASKGILDSCVSPA
jgi:hypothetical protein